MRRTCIRGGAIVLLVASTAALIDCGSDAPAVGGSDAGSDATTSGDTGLPPDGAVEDAGAEGAALPDASDASVDAADSGCNASACASGECLADGGGCVPPCSLSNPCSGTLTCCTQKCVDTLKDPKNCGACGVACTATQFCSSVACADTVFQNVCANPRAAIISDGIAIDDDAGIGINAAIASACTITTRIVPQAIAQGDAGILTDAGKPILGPGETVVAPGGSFRQTAVAYMQQANTPIYDTQAGSTLSLVRRSNASNVVQVLDATITTHHDYFVLQMATEPSTGTLCLISYGFLGGGTAAAAYFLSNTVLPNRATFTDSWYVYEWTDGVSQNSLPDGTDTFTLISSGK